MRTSLALSLAVLLAACGGDSTAPKVDLTGTWAGTWSISGSGVTCSLTIPMQLSHTGAVFSGTYSNASISCNGQSQSGISGSIVNGSVNGNGVTFDVDTAAAHQTGTASGNTMHGSATWTIPTQSGSIVLSGTWSATR